MQAKQPVCNRCQKPVPPDATRCPHCGYTLVQQTPTTMVREQEQRAGQSRNRTLNLILIAVIVIVILFILYLIFSGTLAR